MQNCKYEVHVDYLHPFAVQDSFKGSRLITIEDGPKPSDEPAYRPATEKVVDVEAEKEGVSRSTLPLHIEI
jgi:hypothetical protein